MTASASVGSVVRAPLARTAAGAVAGWVIAESTVDAGPDWQTPAAAAVLAIALLAAPAVGRWAGNGVTSGWALAAALGLYVGVPETDHIVGVIAVLIVLFVAELAGRARVDGWVVAGLDAVIVWAALLGAAGRPGALVAAFAMLGLLVVSAPVALVGRPPREFVPSGWRPAALVALQLGFAIGVARLGGVRTTTSEALTVSAIGIAVLAAASWVVMGPDERTPVQREAP